MDFQILYAIQSVHSPILDQLNLVITKIVGSYGQIWLILAIALLIFKKTRKTGFCIILSYILVLVLGQFVLKDLIARPRPCHLDESIKLLVTRPDSFSCPSTHTAWSFAAATAIFLNHKKAGILALIAAIIVGFSRLYLFVHFPSDVLVGMVMGILLAVISVKLINQRIPQKK
ncbi:MAG: phosphatase PAP2 family protein [Eubacteriales bacterium]|nr:phosphatase PAP2 family protein [Eubacteriales bacterium]